MRNLPLRAIAAGAVAFIMTLIASHLRSTQYDNYTVLAQAFLQGHVWVPAVGTSIDAMQYGAHWYMVEAPLPAVLLMPLAAIFGDRTNQTLLAVLLAGVAIGATWRLGERWDLPWQRNAWLCAFALAGTDLLWCAELGDVWFIAHVAAFAFTMLALAELAGERRAWLVMLWAACAIESRFGMAVAVPIYAYLLLTDPARPLRLNPTWRAKTLGMATVLLPLAAVWVWYNLARWGTWIDIGYTAFYHQDPMGATTGSPFSTAFLQNEIHAFFVEAPKRIAAYPFLVPGMGGQALTWTSPGLLVALLARPLRDRTTIALWVAAIACAVPNFFYYASGYAQLGMRHALDFEPFLIALMALALRKPLAWWWYVLMGYSVAVGVWGVWYWNAYYRQIN